jgi:hypothetical protein
VLIRGKTVSVSSYELLDLTHHPIEFFDEIGMIAMLAKRGHERPVVPNRAVLLSAEPFEYSQTVSP